MFQTRRRFLSAPLVAAAAAAAPSPKDDISLASWSLVRSFRAGKWKNLDLPRILREELGINGLEYVNTFFENPTLRYLQQLKRNCADHGVTSVLIMVDGEGDTAAIERQERMQAAVAHRKWVDIAHYLGCHAIRCNMRGGLREWKQDADLVSRAAESFQDLLDYAKDSGLNILIENHGGASSDAGLLASLMKKVGNPRFGTLPDFGNFNEGDDRYEGTRKLMPYAMGVSVKASWTLEETNPGWDLKRLIEIARESGYHGFWGIESSYARPRRRSSQRGRTESQLSAEQTWEQDKKGVMLTKAVLESTVLKKG